MKFYFHKSNRKEFDRQVDRLWEGLPDYGGCVCEILGHRQSIPDSIREFFFGYVMEEIIKHVGGSKSALHEEFKERFIETYSDGTLGEFHVFGHESKLTEKQKEDFINDVRDFALHKLNIPTEAWRGIE